MKTRLFLIACILHLGCGFLPTWSMTPADSIRQALPSLDDDKKKSAYRELFSMMMAEGNIDGALECLDGLASCRGESEEKKTEAETAIRWNKLAILSAAGRRQQLLDEVPGQMSWFAKHGEWGYYYATWRLKAESYYGAGKLQTALREAQLMQDDAIHRDNNEGRATALQLMSTIYEDMGQLDQAIDAIERAIDLLGDEAMLSEVHVAYDYLCQMLCRQQRYGRVLEVAASWQERLDREAAGADDADMMATGFASCHAFKAAALLGLERFDEAGRELQKAKGYTREGNTEAKRRLLDLFAKFYMAKGDAERALRYSDSIVALGMDDYGPDAQLRADILLLLGRSDEAARMYRDMYHVKDSLFSRDMRMQLDELNTLFHVDELEMKGQLERSRFISGIVVIVALALLLFIFYRVRSARRLEQAHEQLLQAHRQLEETNLKLEQSNEKLEKTNLKLENTNEKLEKAIAQLMVARARAEESSKMKTNFIQQISHEIRTPLNILSGFTQIITTPGMELDDATRQEVTKGITDNTDRITGLVNKMLELSDASSQATIELSDDVLAVQIAAQAAEDSRITMATHLTFDLQLDEGTDIAMLHTSLASATRALVLLLDNAQKFTRPAEAALPMQAKGRLERVTLRVAFAQPSQVAFIVEDTGIGVPPSEAEHIFDEFVQLDEYYDGTGIGLTVARSLARRMGGDIVLDTAYEGGARFVMTLPIA